MSKSDKSLSFTLIPISEEKKDNLSISESKQIQIFYIVKLKINNVFSIINTLLNFDHIFNYLKK